MNALDCLSGETLRAYQNGTADAASINTVVIHLSGCATCLERMQGAETPDDPLLAALRRQRGVPASPLDPFVAAAVSRVLSIQSKASLESDIQLGPGVMLHEYRLLEKLDSGGMGTVFRALHVRLDKEVALKVIHPARVRDPRMRQRFGREMKAIGKLRHPNIVLATDAGESQGVLYLVMELEQGADLARYVREQGRLPIALACDYARQAALGLQYAHETGLVHRDVKPSNLFRTSSGQIKILDLGLALLAVADESPPDVNEKPVEVDSATDVTPLDTHCTLGPMGTDEYMAPEQWNNAHRVDARADLYSLGCTLFFLLTGRPPFSAPASLTRRQIRESHLYASPPALRSIRPDASPLLEALLNRLLAKKPDERFVSAAEVARQFAAACQPKSRRALWAAIVGLLLSGAFISAFVLNLTRNDNTAPTKEGPAETVARTTAKYAAATTRTVSNGPQSGVLPMPPAEARALQQRWATHLGEEIVTTNSIGMKMVVIPPGKMATAESMLILSKPFRASVTEVTRAQFRAFVNDASYFTQAQTKGFGGSLIFKPGHSFRSPKYTWSSPGYDGAADDHPVVHVSWDDAVAFCEWLSRHEKAEYRLPTITEWHWLCRAGADTQFYHGDDPKSLSDYAWHGGNSQGRPHSVGDKQPNAWGLFDTLGNVREWCWDGAGLMRAKGEVIDPIVPSLGTTRLSVGGDHFADVSTLEGARSISCKTSGASQRSDASSSQGFRVVCTTK